MAEKKDKKMEVETVENNVDYAVEEKTLEEKLSLIQIELKVPKNQKNTFGNYNFRSCEDILEKVKPFLKQYNLALLLTDEIILLGDKEPTALTNEFWDENSKRVLTTTTITNNQRFYVKATAKLIDAKTKESISNFAFAREEDSKKGMDASQITGTASSYARKYALNGLFGLDDVKDADSNEFAKTTNDNTSSDNSTITKEEAENLVVNFGKHTGKKLIDIFKEDINYIDWLKKAEKTAPVIKKCIEILEEENDKLLLISQMKKLESETNTEHEEILKYFEVESDQNMTVEQLKESISILKRKVDKKVVEKQEEKTPYDF